MVLSSSSSSRLSKRGRSLVSCVVDGCFSDLSKCKEYHRKHKVCEVHSKTVMVLVGGREQRFCQQCSRFHLLVEFDEVKRSCRKRLAGHNRRRRKPQLNSLNPASFMTNHQGARPTQFPITIPKSTCAPAIKEEKAPFFTYFNRSPPHLINDHNYQHFPVSSHGISKQVKQFPFLPENINIDKAPIASMRGSLLNSSSKIYDDSHRALSLLSSPVGKPLFPAVSNVVAPTGFLYSGTEQDIKSFQTHGLFLVGSEGSSDGSSHHTFYPSLASRCSN